MFHSLPPECCCRYQGHQPLCYHSCSKDWKVKCKYAGSKGYFWFAANSSSILDWRSQIHSRSDLPSNCDPRNPHATNTLYNYFDYITLQLSGTLLHHCVQVGAGRMTRGFMFLFFVWFENLQLIILHCSPLPEFQEELLW